MMHTKTCTKGTVIRLSQLEEATNARLAPVSIVEWVIFRRAKRKERRLGKI